MESHLNLTSARTASRQPAIRLAAQMMARTRQFLARAYRAQHDTRHLTHFNDHMLRDIGISRSEVDADVHRGQSTPWR